MRKIAISNDGKVEAYLEDHGNVQINMDDAVTTIVDLPDEVWHEVAVNLTPKLEHNDDTLNLENDGKQ